MTTQSQTDTSLATQLAKRRSPSSNGADFAPDNGTHARGAGNRHFTRLARSIHNSETLHSLVLSMFRGLQRVGISVTPNHFYFPVPDVAELERTPWRDHSMPVGLDLRIEQQIEFVRELAERYGAEWNFPTQASDLATYHYNNGFFEMVDAEIAYSLVRKFQPSRIIEVGGGYSTRLLALALRRNLERDGIRGELITVDPYCDLPTEGTGEMWTLIRQPVQEVDLDLFLSLGENDILFLDSSHVVSVGSDAVREYLDIVPRVQKGVIVHAHDIFLPSDYPREPVLRNLCFWSEQYLLQSFLAFNPNFEVLWGSSSIQICCPQVLEEIFPRWRESYRTMPKDKRRFVPTPDGQRVWPSSFWIRRVG